MLYGMNVIETVIAVVLSFIMYYGMGFLMGKVMYKYRTGYSADIGLTLVLVYTNVKQNIGWSKLIHALHAAPFGAVCFVVMIMLTTTAVVALTMCAGTRTYNKLRFRKEVKWLI